MSIVESWTFSNAVEEEEEEEGEIMVGVRLSIPGYISKLVLSIIE